MIPIKDKSLPVFVYVLLLLNHQIIQHIGWYAIKSTHQPTDQQMTHHIKYITHFEIQSNS